MSEVGGRKDRRQKAGSSRQEAFGERFPEDFMFQLTREEFESLNRSQIVTA